MAGRKRRKLNKLAEAGRDKSTVSRDNENKPDEQQSWLGPLKDPLQLIMSRLTLKENIIASIVCKEWLAVAKSVRKVKKPPWLMSFPKSGNLFEFLDPLRHELHTLELPELRDSKICHSRNGWLLVYKTRTEQLNFFKPYTREVIKLPEIDLIHQSVAFSAAPTSNSCIVFTVKQIDSNLVAVSTCRPGATEWTTVNYTSNSPFLSSIWSKIAFSAGKFYCLSFNCWLGIYDPENHSWIVHVLSHPNRCENFFLKQWWNTKFLAENNGEFFAIFASDEVNPVIYKLDLAIKEWMQVKTLGGLTIFASFWSSHALTGLDGTMTNSVYFPKYRLYGKRCISYSLYNNRYYPKKQYYEWAYEDIVASIWIEPPEDLSSFV